MKTKERDRNVTAIINNTITSNQQYENTKKKKIESSKLLYDYYDCVYFPIHYLRPPIKWS